MSEDVGKVFETFDLRGPSMVLKSPILTSTRFPPSLYGRVRPQVDLVGFSWWLCRVRTSRVY